jgi:GAF domain-containing protein
VAPEEVFAAVTQEVGRLLPVDVAIMGRYETDGTITCVAAWGSPAVRFPVGGRSKLEGENLVTIVLETSRPARVDHFAHASGPIGVTGRRSGFHSAVGTPIVVGGRVWGVMTVSSTVANRPLPPDIEARLESFTELVVTAVANAESRAPVTVEGRLWGMLAAYSALDQSLPADTDSRLASFTDLVAAAIANAESRAALARIAEEQAALRRVATLVAGGASPEGSQKPTPR